MSRRQGAALGLAAAVTIAGAGYSLSTLDSRQALATNEASTPAVAASSVRASGSPNPTGTPPASGAASNPTTPAPGTPSASADGLLLPAAPWERIPDATAQTGRVDLARAVAIDGHGSLSRTGLRQLGFDAGMSRAWQAGAAALLILDYTFRDAKGAAGFVAYGRRARDADRGFRRMPVTGIPGALAYQTAGAGATTRVVLFSSGRSAYIVGIQGTPPTGTAGDVTELARAQYRVAAAP